MSVSSKNVDYDVVQIGYGPVSKASALFLNRLGWSVGIFERFADVYPLPRAVCIDHELYRVLHAAGLGDVAKSVCTDAPVYRWFNADWKELLAIDWSAGSVSGGAEVTFIHQPTFERAMDTQVKNAPGVDLTFNAECVGVRQTDDYAVVTIKDAKTGEIREVTARYVLGIDGANSFVRENLGIGRSDLGFEADWLVIDFALNNGLTARDLGIPEAGQYANPERPTTIVPGGIEADGRVCRRWEFMRLPHETREEMNKEEKVWELLGDWIKPDQGELVRHTVYTFRSLVADTFQKGRIFLAGDAAHVMPPFMGQGMCAGLRDAWNLAWKLDLVMSGKADASLLETYTPERAPHVTDIIKISMFLGSIICMPDKAEAAKRDEMFLGGNAPRPAPFPILTDGMLQRDKSGVVVAPAGELSPHGAVRHQGKTERYDSFVPVGFTLVLNGDFKPSEVDAAICARREIQIVNVADRRTATDNQIGDTQGQFGRFMDERNLQAMLVRPDFYLFGGASDAAGLSALLMEFERQCHVHHLVAAE
ncbi:bifunctional 3-(3-hydroxy-phenyl)propionate/3-hydroxycinnamic acid hydroxylase [Martelella soudanensis]|uniref:bifunctional 3-(3-hydroxy-phenyl)propionate/3-hydroxycinnamic acid hydroxylase n=1 Tax=unclassified Martelella TaxID=2629616 RepID=UPI0015DF7B88|nr:MULTISPECIES: bifunctional 3-(3-hydroxy-phenyl)propionate/3-hydroxycinnamic acid hydroxylase [unclassified Martelella]